VADVPCNSEETERIAAVAELYQQGVRNPGHTSRPWFRPRADCSKSSTGCMTMGESTRSIGPISVESEHEKGN
jgi:hypothetical protein